MNTMINCIKKDLLEIRRNKKLILCSISLIVIAIFVQIIGRYNSVLTSILVEKGGILVSDPQSIIQLFQKLFPSDLRNSLAIYASDIGIFYFLIEMFICVDLLPNEIREHRWIFPISAGYKKSNLLLSKVIVYSLQLSIPVFIVFNTYSIIGSFWMATNISPSFTLLLSSVMAIVCCLVSAFTIMLSVIFKNKITTLITMISTVIISPDIFYIFSFGKYLPTQLLSFVYTAQGSPSDLVIPLIISAVLLLICFIYASQRIENMEVER